MSCHSYMICPFYIAKNSNLAGKYKYKILSSILFTKSLSRLECRPLHQLNNSRNNNRVDGIITSNNEYDLLFSEEKPPSSSPAEFTQDNKKCEKLWLENLRRLLTGIKNAKLLNHVEILSINWNGYDATLCGIPEIGYTNENNGNKEHGQLYLHYVRQNWTIPTSLSDGKSINQFIDHLIGVLKLKGILEHNKEKLDLIIDEKRNNTDEREIIRILHELDSRLEQLSVQQRIGIN